MRAVLAGATYAAIVFAIGFVLGALRIFLLAPRVGTLAATLIELPLILSAAWFVARLLVVRFVIAPEVPQRLAMGVVGFALLMALEALLGLALGRSISAQLADMTTLAGLVGLVGQIAFGLMPLLARLTVVPKEQVR